MIKLDSIKNLYQNLTVREKVLLLAFSCIVVGVWLYFLKDSISSQYDAITLLDDKHQHQQNVLAKKQEIQAKLNTVLDRFDPNATFDDARLAGRMDTIAREAKLSADLLKPYTKEGTLFNTHQLEIQIRSASLKDLVLFVLRIEAESPYVKIHRMSIEPQKANRELLDSRIVVTSFKLKQSNF